MKKKETIFYNNRTFSEVISEAFKGAICITFYLCFFSAILIILTNILNF